MVKAMLKPLKLFSPQKSSHSSNYVILNAVCPELKVMNGFVAYCQYRGVYIARYRCKLHYELIGNRDRVCQIDGTWSGSDPYCQSEAKQLSVFSRN